MVVFACLRHRQRHFMVVFCETRKKHPPKEGNTQAASCFWHKMCFLRLIFVKMNKKIYLALKKRRHGKKASTVGLFSAPRLDAFWICAFPWIAIRANVTKYGKM